MCGISGFVDYSKNTSREILEKMNRTLSHRGPDGEGYAMFGEGNALVGLGHRRLSIIDLTEGGSQPQSFDSLHITFNGEIYNYAEIKSELEKLGHTFLSHSDTEVILHAYREWGHEAIQRFIGMFAFVIYDEKKNKIFACRDRPGVKPFIYYWKNGLFLFGSELKALMQHPSFKKEISNDAVAAFMQYGYVPAPHCIFNDTHKLRPGHYLELDIATASLQTSEYWSVYTSYNKPPLKIDLPEAITETEKILTSAFQYRMVADVPVGVFLSGGYDSSCVAAILQANNSEKIRTFTIGVPDAGLNEAPFAKEIAAHLGTDHTEYYCTAKEALDIVPELPYYYDEPFADSSAIPTTLVSRIASEKVTVALSADGGDEIFAGYKRYDHVMNYGKKLQDMPAFMRKGAAALMKLIPANAIPVLNKKLLFQDRYDKVKSLLKDPSELNVVMSLSRLMNDEDIISLLKRPAKPLSSPFESKELHKENYSALAFTMAIDYQTYLPDDILQKVDRATMSAGLEGREPFLDQRIIEWAAQLPMDYKYHSGSKKFILKEIVHKYLPEQMMNRPKMGFGIPIATWLKNDLKHYVDQFFEISFIKKQDIFEYNEIERIKNAFYEGKPGRPEKIWYLLMFQMWYDRWMNN